MTDNPCHDGNNLCHHLWSLASLLLLMMRILYSLLNWVLMLRRSYTAFVSLFPNSIQVLGDNSHKVSSKENEGLDNLNHSNILRHHNHEEYVHTALLHNNKVSQVDRGRLLGSHLESIYFQTKCLMIQTKPKNIFEFTVETHPNLLFEFILRFTKGISKI